jgi:muramoyltetrapeptide carboxypeptidase
MSISIPPYIKKGARFGLVSPAGKINPEIISIVEDFLYSNGYQYKWAPHAKGSYFQYSGTDEQRTADMQQMIDDPQIDVIWCNRGGYGAIRIIDDLNFSNLTRFPKWLIGFSDITVFHAALQNIFNIASIHGPMPVKLSNENRDAPDWENMFEMLEGREVMHRIPGDTLNHPGNAAGQLIGGNLATICSLCGTKYDFDPKGKILLIEEVGEKLYKVDRMMQQLKLGGKLNDLAGIVVGHLTDMEDNTTPFGLSPKEIIHETVKDYEFPILFNFPSGHSLPNQPLMLGAQIHMQIDNTGGLLVYP